MKTPNAAVRRLLGWERRRSRLALAGLVLVSVLSLSLPKAEAAECRQWGLSGVYYIQQTDGYTVRITVTGQRGTEFTGEAGHRDRGGMNGRLTGHLRGDDFDMVITWGTRNDTHGIYTGTVTSQGRLEGRMFHKQNPANKARWFSDRAAECWDQVRTAPAATPVPTPKPPTFTGDAEEKKRLMADPQMRIKAEMDRSQGAAAQAAEQAAKEKAAQVAGISANPTTVETDGEKGETTLTWNAGASRPNAEVWVQINGRDQKLLFSGSKGSQTVTVKRGRTYRYLLRDGRQQLSTVTVRAR